MNSLMVIGKDNIRQFWSKAFETLADATLEVQDVETQGDLLVEYGTYTMKNISNSQAPQTFAGKYMVAWKNISGNWKLHRDIFNAD